MSIRGAGFTLLELLLVVCILGILLAASLPQFSGAQGHLQLRELAKTLCAELRFCQEYAAARTATVRMDYVPGLQRYVVQVATDPAASQFQDLATPWDSILEMPAAVQVDQFAVAYSDGQKDTNRVTFTPYGPAPAVEISLHGGSRQVLARYAGATHLATIQEQEN